MEAKGSGRQLQPNAHAGFQAKQAADDAVEPADPTVGHCSNVGRTDILRVPATVTQRKHKATALLDTGACDNFIHRQYVAQHGLPVGPKGELSTVLMGNGTVGQIVGTVTTKVAIGAFHVTARFHVLDLCDGFDLILGLPWLKQHCDMEFSKSRLMLRKAGLAQRVAVQIAHQQVGLVADEDSSTPVINAATAFNLLKKKQCQGFMLVIKAADAESIRNAHSEATGAVPSDQSAPTAVEGLKPAGVFAHSRGSDVKVAANVPVSTSPDSTGAPDSQPSASKPPDTVPDCGLQEWADVLTALLSQYGVVFEVPDKLPPDRNIPHCIPTEPGARPPYRKSYLISPKEKEHLIKQITELLLKGWIQPSVSPYGAPVLFVRKKDGSLRMCVDYRALNNITIKNKYPLPRIDTLLDTLQGAKCFSTMDLHSGYHQIKLHPDDVPKTAFSTPSGHYEYLVIPMGLSNAPSTFQAVMNNVFRDMLDKFVLIYLDDILIYSRTPEEHAEHLQAVLQRLLEHDLKAKLSKCEFFKPNVKFLGHIVGEQGTQVDPDKVAVVKNWPRPKTPGDVRSFLGLANYFRKFIQGFAELARPLQKLTTGSSVGVWGQAEEDSFQGIKAALTEAPVLAMPDNAKDFVLVADASKHSLGAVLLQEGHPVAFYSSAMTKAELAYHTTEQELLAVLRSMEQWRCFLMDKPFTVLTDHNPNVFFETKPSQNLSPRQIRWQQKLALFNYRWEYKPGKINVADPLSRLPPGAFSSLCANVVALMACMPYKTAASAAVLTVMTRSAASKQSAAAKQAAAAEAQPAPPRKKRKQKGSNAPFTVELQPTVVLPGSAPTMEAEAIDTPTQSAELGAPVDEVAHADEQSTEDMGIDLSFTGLSELEAKIARAYVQDERFEKKSFTRKMQFKDGLYLYQGRIYVPAVPELYAHILVECHDAVYSGHLGIHKTLQKVRSKFYWSGMSDMVKEYVATCPSCQRIKANTLAAGGLLQNTELPGRPWAYVCFDFCTGLPTTKHGYDAVAVWCCILTKMVHFVPYKQKSMGAAELAEMYLQHIFKLHGLPLKLVSDRDPLFTSAFWQEIHKHLSTTTAMSSGHHAQTNGQTERMNRVMEEMLRQYINPLMDDWDVKLPLLEFAYNSAHHESTGASPFQLNYGMIPLTPASTLVERNFRLPAAERFCERMALHLKRARLCLDRARARAKAQVDKSRRDVSFEPGSMVLLATENLQLKLQAPKKLLPKFVGPFEVLEKVGPVAYKLQLPDTMRCHDVFHVSNLQVFKSAGAGELAGQDKFGRMISCPEGIEVDGGLEYAVEAILDHRIRWGKTWYLVKWLGFGPEHCSWEPAHYLEDVKALDEYEASMGS
jgi:hypothetical protein